MANPSFNSNLQTLKSLCVPYEVVDRDKNGVLSKRDEVTDASGAKVTYQQAIKGIEAFLTDRLNKNAAALQAVIPRRPSATCFTTGGEFIKPRHVLYADWAYRDSLAIFKELKLGSALRRSNVESFNTVIERVNTALAEANKLSATMGCGFGVYNGSFTPQYDWALSAPYAKLETTPCK